LQLTGIPTLVHWKDGDFPGKLGPELESASSTEEADSMIRQFVSQHCAENRARAIAAGSADAVDVQALMQQLQNSSTNGKQ